MASDASDAPYPARARGFRPRHLQRLIATGVRQRRVLVVPRHASLITRHSLLLLAVLAASSQAMAFELQFAEAKFVDEEYRFEMTAVLDAPIQYVDSVLRDYESYKTLDSRILEARVLERSDEEHTAVLATTLRACFGPICRNVKRIERVEESAFGLLAVTDASRSDMTFGETRMQLTDADEGRTRVTYQTRLKPGFWIPALIARRMMLTTLEDATIELFQNVEKRAQQR